MVRLKDFSLVCPDIQSADILKAMETAIPVMAIEQAINLRDILPLFVQSKIRKDHIPSSAIQGLVNQHQ